MPKQLPQNIPVTIFDLNEKGFGIGKGDDDYQYFVLNSLPGETVLIRVYKQQKKVRYGVATEIAHPSPHREKPRDEHFLASSPWEIMNFEEENRVKEQLIRNEFQKIGLTLPDFTLVSANPEQLALVWNYRNKVEFSFYGHEDETIDLAFFMRASHNHKLPLKSSAIIAESMNQAAAKIVAFLNQQKIQARQLKTLILRYSFSENKVLAGLFVKDESLTFTQESIENIIDDTIGGLQIIYSNPKSPASVTTKILFQAGQDYLQETIETSQFRYGLEQFFQINPPLFTQTINDIRTRLSQLISENKLPGRNLVDLYAGVGTIGLCLAPLVEKVQAVEITSGSKEFALENARINGISNYEFYETGAESSLDFISEADILVIDPPRSGLHQSVIQKIQETKPPIIVYLSCNPATQARDVGQFHTFYECLEAKGYNYYPHTPHVENLLVLRRID